MDDVWCVHVMTMTLKWGTFSACVCSRYQRLSRMRNIRMRTHTNCCRWGSQRAVGERKPIEENWTDAEWKEGRLLTTFWSLIRLRSSSEMYNSHRLAWRSCLNAYIFFIVRHFPLKITNARHQCPVRAVIALSNEPVYETEAALTDFLDDMEFIIASQGTRCSVCWIDLR